MKNFSEYTYTVMPRHFGEGYSLTELREITSMVVASLAEEFPGLRIECNWNEGAPTPTRGPDSETIQDIDQVGETAFNKAERKVCPRH